MISKKRFGKIKIAFYSFLVFFSVLSAACVPPESGSYHDAGTYQNAIFSETAHRSFSYEGPMRNPVIVIHGLLGAKLTDYASKQNIWGDFSYQSISDGRNFHRLAHPMQPGKPLNALHNEVRSSGVLEQSSVNVLGMNFYIDNYDILLDVLKKCGYQPEVDPLPREKHFPSLFVFHYDWRRDISENARDLGEFIRKKKAVLQKHYAAIYQLRDYPVRFDLIGHSMGGLLARYYVMYGSKLLPEKESEPWPVTWAGADNISKVIMIGTPNAGYADTLLELNHGLRLVAGAPVYPKALIGTFVSFYQMLPDPSCTAVLYDDGSPVDYFSEKIWEQYRWGMLDPGQDPWLKILLPNVKDAQVRREIVLDHLRKCLRRARQFKKAMLPARLPEQPAHLQFHLIAGDAVMTAQKLAVNRQTGSVKTLRMESGDGKILSSSALFDRRSNSNWKWQMDSPIRWDSVLFMQGGHMGIMNGASFASNLSFLLAGIPSK